MNGFGSSSTPPASSSTASGVRLASGARAHWRVAQQPGHLGRPVRQNEVGTRPADRGQRLEDHGVAVDPTVRRGRLDHRVLTADLIRRDRHVDHVAHPPDDIEVGHRRLDHHHVGTFGDVESDLAQRLVAVRDVLLVACVDHRTAVRIPQRREMVRTKRRRTSPNRRAPRPQKTQHRRGLRESQRPGRPSSRSVRRRASPRWLAQLRSMRNASKSRIVVDHLLTGRRLDNNSAVPVVGVLVEAKIAHQHGGVADLGREIAQRELHDARRIVGTRTTSVLVRRNPEQDQSARHLRQPLRPPPFATNRGCAAPRRASTRSVPAR